MATAVVILLHQHLGTADARWSQSDMQNVWNCGADIVTHCANVKPGDGRIADCLHDNKRLITSMCSHRRDTPDHTPSACKSDAAKLCEEDAGDSSIQLICLRKKKDLVSEKCWERLAKIGTHGFEVLPMQFKQMAVDSQCTVTLLKHCG